MLRNSSDSIAPDTCPFPYDRLTGTGGAAFVAEAAKRLGLLPRLAAAVSVSVKNWARGASDAETQWSLIASLAAGNGSLSDVDALRGDGVQRELLGLREAPSSRRVGEFLGRLTKWDVERLEEVARHLSASLAATVVEHEVAEKGYVPVFVDGTGIEVDGRLFEHAARLYTGERGYWLHGIFVGGLWVSGRLRPGGDVACGWKGQMKRDLAPLLAPGTPVWVHCDSAYYRGGFVEYVSSRGWDYSVSVTDANKCRPVLDVVEDLPEHGWTDIGMGESATRVRYRPAKWRDEQSYVVVRRAVERQGELLPRFTVILANRDDLPLAEVVRRHRSKQGPALRAGSKTPSRVRWWIWTCTIRRAGATGPTRRSTPTAGWRTCCCARSSTGCCRRPRGGTASGRWCGT